jgi:hypothetical protein
MTSVICWGWPKGPGPTNGRGSSPPFLLSGCKRMRELSVFIDESGDFGAYEHHSPFYLLTLVFHDQSIDISPNLLRLRNSMSHRGFPDYTVHAGPLIRREDEYWGFSISERQQIFNALFHFVRTIDITYRSIIVEKKQLAREIDLNIQISKQLSSFLNQNMEIFMQFARIVVYYDYGQRELTNILVTAFTTIFSNVEFRKVAPANYKLFQAADMLCTLELLALKAEKKVLSNSELAFFNSERELKKSYLRAIQKKRMS